MIRDLAIIFYYSPLNKYSVNAIVAAVDVLQIGDIYLVDEKIGLLKVVRYLSKKYKRVVVGIGFNTLMLADDSFLYTLLELNRGKPGNIITLAGGPHASGDPLGTILKLGFDIAIIGEGEQSIQELLRAIIDDRDYCRVKGVFTVSDGKICFSGRPRPIDLNRFHPFPFWRHLFSPIEITRGCPYGCFYCQVSYMHGFKPRHRSIDKILYYSEIMAREGFKDIRFITPNSLGYGIYHRDEKPRIDIIEEFLSRLYAIIVKKYGGRIFFGTFPSEIRPEHLDYEVAKMLKKYVANKEIILGAQSGSNKILEIMRRGHTIEDVYNAVEACIKAGFIPSVDFIIGLPYEDEEDIKLTLKAMKKIVSMGGKIHLHTFLPLPGTPYTNKPPGRIPSWVKKEVFKLIGKGAAYGQWIQQEKIARKIDELRRKGLILSGSMDRL
ncbi:MAG: TIGR04013 family B12-binding domain/radical SAM domain-containing protein [Desulfurococcales archaeon]|nr:TIGR04013 family B12-binding domain/radical SAM domain-containing protein [Desulfurococcales archaeon]